MTSRPIDRDKLRTHLRSMPRGKLLILVERAIELVPMSKLRALVRDYIRLEEVAVTPDSALLGEVKKFHAASLRGDYYESFAVNSKNFMDKSEETDSFIAEFERLIGKCLRAAAKEPRAPAREAFELLFALLRRIDEGNDDVIFFADEGGSWEVDVNWRDTLRAYFRCLADTASPEEFAREVERAIKDFVHYDRPFFLRVASRMANAAQKAALRALPKAKPRA